MRRTKIVATLGPASIDPATIVGLIGAGADVFRLNFAHADPETHRTTAQRVRQAERDCGRTVGLLADLPGPKMRTGPVPGGEILLQPGQVFRLAPTADADDPGCVSTTVAVSQLVSVGDEIFLADGQIILEVVRVDDGVTGEVLRGGSLRSGKGMHIPGAERKVESFTPRDKAALDLACEIGVDIVGLSFVRSAHDVAAVKERAADGARTPAVIAKIETRAAVEDLDEIVHVADAVMVARGDLGIQLPYREVPLLQKTIIRTCNASGIPVITATQMLESMTHSPLPTRAEVNDVANAVIDGTDALMLSEETAVGDAPTNAVRVMGEIALEAEQCEEGNAARTTARDDPISWAIARAAVQASEELNVAAILCPTRSGATARRVASFRPSMPILALDHSAEVLRPLTLVWGVVPFEVPFLAEEDVAARGIERALAAARRSGLAEPGDRLTLVAGATPPAGSTDVVRIVTV